MSQLPLPIIDWQRCTGCGLCIEVCPPHALAQVPTQDSAQDLAQVLTQQGGKAYLREPDACTYCSACEEICPEDAIALPFMILVAPDQPPTQEALAKDSTR